MPNTINPISSDSKIVILNNKLYILVFSNVFLTDSTSPVRAPVLTNHNLKRIIRLLPQNTIKGLPDPLLLIISTYDN